MKRRCLLLHCMHLLLSLTVLISILYVATFGVGPLPPLGSTLNVGTGVWTTANSAKPPHCETLHIVGLQKPVTVIFEANGTPHIQATTDNDLFLSIGYLHAYFRLTQMDLMRRQGEGRLAEILGPDALASDRFEIMLGLARTAQANWQALPTSSLSRRALLSYAQGVNAWISEAEKNNSLPFMFKLLNYQPQPWTPIDTLVVQNDLTQEMGFSVGPLDYAMMVKALGYQRTMQWFPVLPPDTQHPYDTGPYPAHTSPAPIPAQLTPGQEAMQSVARIAQQIDAMPHALRDGSASNNWAINGTKTVSGKALMAGDPHLDLTLPSIWYQLDASSPSYTFSGVSIPGIPLVLCGRNQHISWSLTDVQNESTLFYIEKTDRTHPNQYYWDGDWRQMQHIPYTIEVKGSPSVHLDVSITVHGPVYPTTQGLANEVISVDWMGALPSSDFEAFLQIQQATNYSQFSQALRKWDAPTLNFIYADDQGNIGMIAPGYYPIVKSGVPWLPLPGTGEADVIGSIPFDSVPQVYDPPDHMVFSANQRPVGNNYPYYIGTSWDGFDNGYRADEIYNELNSKKKLNIQDMERMQNSTHDYLAELLVPVLLKSLQHASLSSKEQQAILLLQSWNGNMDVGSPAASIWWTFWTRYLIDIFEPWWKATHVPVAQHTDLAITPNYAPLDEDVETWTLHDPTNAVFTPPGGTRRDASVVMLQAFQESVEELNRTIGDTPTQWLWGKLHSRRISSLLQVSALDYGPRASGGGLWTLNSVGGDSLRQNNPTLSPSVHGPSWRFIVDWSSGQAEAIYPGGQSENPVSPWYENEIESWWNGMYYPIITSSIARRQTGSVIWILRSEEG